MQRGHPNRRPIQPWLHLKVARLWQAHFGWARSKAPHQTQQAKVGWRPLELERWNGNRAGRYYQALGMHHLPPLHEEYFADWHLHNPPWSSVSNMEGLGRPRSLGYDRVAPQLLSTHTWRRGLWQPHIARYSITVERAKVCLANLVSLQSEKEKY